MMFIQFFIWGAWYVTMGTFLANNLNSSATEIGQAYSTSSWGAIIAPFFVGLIADRFFNAEKLLGILHLIGAVLMYMLFISTDFASFYPFVLAYNLVFMPTLALVNSVSFYQMKDPAKEFSVIRVFGTIGWIVAGLMISFVFSWDSQATLSEGLLKNTFLMGAIASAVLGLMSFTLPKTPPRMEKGEKVTLGDIVGVKALTLFKDRNFGLFFGSSILICIPLAFYYQHTNQFLVEIGMENTTGKMTLGQVSEVVFMLLIPIFLKRFGIKWTLLIGMLAWALRYVLFAYGNVGELEMFLITGILLHGICYDFFFVSGQIYTDSKAGEQLKSTAQGLITLATYGVGMLIGFIIAGFITDSYAITENVHNWQSIWMYPAIFAAGVAVLFALLFKKESL